MRRPTPIHWPWLFGGAVCVALGASGLAALVWLVAIGTRPPNEPRMGVPAALAVDTVLVGLFGLQHSGMARSAWKRRVMPDSPAAQRLWYVALSGAVLWLLVLLWQPLPGMVYRLSGAAAAAMHALSAGGLVLVVWATHLTGGWQLLGVDAWLTLALGRPPHEAALITRGPYRWIRHPLILGVLILLWATPELSVSRLVLNAALGAYALLGVVLEERDLTAQFGESYRRYRQQTYRLLPGVW